MTTMAAFNGRFTKLLDYMVFGIAFAIVFGGTMVFRRGLSGGENIERLNLHRDFRGFTLA